MKNNLISILIILFFIGIFVAMSRCAAAYGDVISKNAVGYFTKHLEANKIYLLSLPYHSSNFNVVEQLPINSRVFTWNKKRQTYNVNTSDFDAGDGFFVIPSSNASIKIYGEAPDSDITQRLEKKFNLFGYPYPVSVDFKQTDLYNLKGCTLYTWNVDMQKYEKYKSTKKGWEAIPNIELGEGFWLDIKKNNVWKENKPYEWP